MALNKQVTYKPRGESATFVLYADEAAFYQFSHGEPWAPSDDLTKDKYRVLRCDPTGNLFPPDPDELEKVFGTDDERYVSHYIARNGVEAEIPAETT